MATATQPLKPLPAPDARWIGTDGRPTPEFYEYVKRLDALVRALRLEIP